MQGKPAGFRKKVLNSAKLSGLRFASDVGLRLISTVVLTRLLTPEIYGVFAIVLVYLYLLEMFSDFGIRSLILTREGEVATDFLQTCWTVSIARGLIIAAVSAGIALSIGLLQGQNVFSPDNPYAAPALPWAIAVLGGTAFLFGFHSPMPFMHEREMKFVRVTVVAVTTNIIALVATIILAYYLRSIWALVLGNILKAAIQVSLSFLVFRGPPMRLNFDRNNLQIVIDRGKWIIGHSALTAISQSADRLVLGLVMSSASFGFYFIARQLVDILSKFLMSVNTQMGLQVFTHLQKSSVDAFRRNYYRYRLFFDVLAGLGTGGLLVLAPVAVQIIFDDRYLGVAPMVQVLVWGVLLTGPLLLRSALSAERQFKRMTMLSLLSTGTLWLGLMASIFLLESQDMALMVIALHRLPEAMALILVGGERDWVVVWREFMGFVFCAVGIAFGWVALTAWNALI